MIADLYLLRRNVEMTPVVRDQDKKKVAPCPIPLLSTADPLQPHKCTTSEAEGQDRG